MRNAIVNARALRPSRRSRSASRARQRGVSSIMLLVLLIPLLLSVGVAVDFARMVHFRSDLQNAVDKAALAGAAVYVDSSEASKAKDVATRYFNHAILPASVSVSPPSVSTNAGGTINPALGTASAYTVTVSASAKVATTLMALFVPSSQTISAQGTAANPIVTPNLTIPATASNACDGNTVYLYQVPKNADGSYDYSRVPQNSSDYYPLYSSYASSTSNAPLPTFSVNQPLGVMLRNDTNGNVNNPNCKTKVTGANSYGAPNGASQTFYSSLLMNGQSPSDLSNYSYYVDVKQGQNGSVSSVTVRLPPSMLNPAGSTLMYSGSSLSSWPELLGPNALGSSRSNCTNAGTSKSGTSTTVTYNCTTQYRTSQSNTASNCLLYVQTGVSTNYLNNLTNTSSAPLAARYNCFNVTSGGASYSAPSCSLLSSLAGGSGSSSTAPAAVFWWDDGGGVGPNEQNYSPAGHCSGMSSGSAGYGEDCLYKNMVVALQCKPTGGSGTGYTQVVLSQ